MSAPHIILDNLPSMCQNCQIWWKFDVVITKIILLVFLRHGVQCESKKSPLRGPDIFHFFHKRLRIFNRFFTHLL